ncbi:phage tail family protein [Paenibacillus wynnii]|uniref:Phage tail protein n=1 Tax=Paenibacillus wynnii TaxID=268407 RepID=A0A098M2M8_9BACL|nr:phage tail family protein [Paenibacillus wynnii]KGE16231.1 hypothetical protein PWYN_15805 [Paenibacillus wynnii]KGE20633.1 hypothetical protein PWYN_15750 [Paenibacillus wynnii]KGE21107.1 hypothetical protein PWYN_02970 [Paenibacillus wynnii]
MQKLSYTNDRGGKVVFENLRPFILSHIDGIGSVDTDVRKTTGPFQDGSTVYRVAIKDRLLSIQGAILANSRDELYALRRQLSQILNPKIMGQLVYQNDDRAYTIGGIAESGPIWGERYANNQLFTASFLCPDPYLLDEFDSSDLIATWIGGLSFPVRFPNQFATRGAKSVNVINEGDVDTPVRIEIYGPATNPCITNHSIDRYIKVNRVLLSGDKLTITTHFGNKRVEIQAPNGSKVNVLHWIDPNSSLWSLQPGDNIVKYTSDDPEGIEPFAISINYRNRYFGA